MKLFNRIDTRYFILLIYSGVFIAIFLFSRVPLIYENIVRDKSIGPPLCIMKNSIGLSCPGCGMTRSLLALGNFDIQRSLHFHKFGIPVLLFFFLQMMRYSLALFSNTYMISIQKKGRYLDYSGIGLLIVMTLHWIVSLFI